MQIKVRAAKFSPRVALRIEINTLALPFAGLRPGRCKNWITYLLASNRHPVSKFKIKSSLKLLKTIFTLIKITDLYYFLLLFVISVLNFKTLCFYFVFLHGDDFSCRKGSSRHSASKSKIKSCVKLFTTTLTLLKTIDVFYFCILYIIRVLALKILCLHFFVTFFQMILVAEKDGRNLAIRAISLEERKPLIGFQPDSVARIILALILQPSPQRKKTILLESTWMTKAGLVCGVKIIKHWSL